LATQTAKFGLLVIIQMPVLATLWLCCHRFTDGIKLPTCHMVDRAQCIGEAEVRAKNRVAIKAAADALEAAAKAKSVKLTPVNTTEQATW